MKRLFQLSRTRASFLAVLFVLVNVSWGCATWYASNQVTRHYSVERVAFEDNIVALVQPVLNQSSALDAPLALGIQPRLEPQVSHPSSDNALAHVEQTPLAQSFAALGEKNTYVFGSGGSELFAIAQSLDASRLQLRHTDNEQVDGESPSQSRDIRLSLNHQPEQSSTQPAFDWLSGSISVVYQKSLAQATLHERTQLKQLGFKYQETEQNYVVHVFVLARVYPNTAVTRTAGVRANLSQPRRLVALKNESKTGVHVGPLLLLPAAVVVDVVTAPLQLILLMMLR